MTEVASTPTEQTMWQAVLFTAFVDATRGPTKNSVDFRAARDADAWIRGCGRDFRTVCALAGMDPDFLRDAYVRGRVCPDKLRAAERSHKQVAA